ncbi:MAG: tetratricopeptide repeat protein [Fervidobacterium sp.]
MSEKFHKIILVIGTLFAILFLITYFSNVKLTQKLEYKAKIIKAYELYLNDSKEFSFFVKSNKLKELEWLVSKKQLNEVRMVLDKAKILYREGNYGEAASLLREIKDNENPWNDEVYFYLGMSLYKVGEVESAKLFLSTFLNNFEYSIFRKEALLILKEISTDEIKKQIDKLLNERK